MTDKPMMRCGHAANAQDGAGNPVCVICSIAGAGGGEVDPNPPDITTRTARCAYYSRTPRGRNHEGPCQPGEPCLCERPSTTSLAFYEHRPDQPHDRYYCGCWGWD